MKTTLAHRGPGLKKDEFPNGQTIYTVKIVCLNCGWDFFEVEQEQGKYLPVWAECPSCKTQTHTTEISEKN